MFILRIIPKEGPQTNTIIGDSYEFIGRVESPEEFREMFELKFQKEHFADLDPESNETSKKCYGFIVCNDCTVSIPLYSDNKYYIMTESGKTFSNLSYNNK